MSTSTERPDLFTYADYRRYLADWIAWKRSKGSFSMRWFARQSGFGAPNMLRLVIDGARNLSIHSIRKFATGLALADDEGAYFETLVLMNQARTVQERKQYYERLVGHPKRRKAEPLERGRLGFFQHWLGPVLYEMVRFPDFRPDPAWIADRLGSDLSVRDIRKALGLLRESGLVREEAEGRWVCAEEVVRTGDDVRDVHLFSYHEQALLKASDALHEVPSGERHYHVLTIAAPREALGDLKKLCSRFEEEVHRLLDTYPGAPDEVFQFGLQAFPLTRGKGDRS